MHRTHTTPPLQHYSFFSSHTSWQWEESIQKQKLLMKYTCFKKKISLENSFCQPTICWENCTMDLTKKVTIPKVHRTVNNLSLALFQLKKKKTTTRRRGTKGTSKLHKRSQQTETETEHFHTAKLGLGSLNPNAIFHVSAGITNVTTLL